MNRRLPEALQTANLNGETHGGSCLLRREVKEELGQPAMPHTRGLLWLLLYFALVNFLAASNPRTPALREELNAIRSHDPSVVFHDDLAPVNEPVYFHQFMEHARGHGLRERHRVRHDEPG